MSPLAGKYKEMDDGIVEPQSEWEMVVDKESQDVFSDIEGADNKISPEQLEREKRLCKRQDYWA